MWTNIHYEREQIQMSLDRLELSVDGGRIKIFIQIGHYDKTLIIGQVNMIGHFDHLSFLKKELDDEETMLLEGAPIYFQLCSTIEFQSLTWLFYILEAVIVWLSWYRYCKLFINHQFYLWKMFPRSLWMTICGTRLPSVAEETSLRPQLTMRTRAEVRLRMMARIMMTMKIFGANPHEHLFKCKEIQWQNKAYHPSWVEVALVT